MQLDYRGSINRPKKSIKPFAVFILVILLVAFGSYDRNNKPTIVSSSELPNSLELSQLLGKSGSYLAIDSGAKSPRIFAKSYLLLDTTNAEVIIGLNENQPIAIASTTKMTTALVVMDKLPLDRIVTISSKPPLIEGSKIGLRSGEQITVGSLLKGLLINSGNDTAFALAEAFANKPGDYKEFVDEMNKYAAENNLPNTKFGDPAGLDDDTGRSTPLELAHTARLLLQNPTLSAIVSTPEATITSVDGLLVHRLKNTNRLIQSASSYYLPNALGIKTGFTLEAGHCLVSAYKLKDRILVGVVMNTIESTNTASAEELHKLFLWAEYNLSLKNY